MPDPDSTTLTVGCPSGLANRLRVLLSGMAWQNVTGRRFTMLWPRSAPCAAGFEDLFMPLSAVQEASDSDVMAMPAVGSYLHTPMFDIASSPEPHLRFRASGWLVPPRLSPAAATLSRLLPRAPAPFHSTHQEVLNQAAGLFSTLEPIPPVLDRLDSFARLHFRPRMIGVHLRSGDYSSQRPDAVPDPRRVESAIRMFLQAAPDAGIFLATDDGAVDPYISRSTTPAGYLACLRRAFGDRIVTTTPRSLDRRDPFAIQDALVDLLLLRKTSAFAGTLASSFSELALLGRDVPHIYCGASNPARWIWRITLIEPLVILAGILRYGRLAPFPVLVSHFRERIRKAHGRPR